MGDLCEKMQEHLNGGERYAEKHMKNELNDVFGKKILLPWKVNPML